MEAIRKKLTVLRGEVDEAKDRAEKSENEKREAREEADKVRVCIYIVYMRTTVAVYMHALSSFRKPRSLHAAAALHMARLGLNNRNVLTRHSRS